VGGAVTPLDKRACWDAAKILGAILLIAFMFHHCGY
jgi:hypothetical protein